MCRFAAEELLVDGVARTWSALVDPHDCAKVFNQVVMLRDILPDLRDPSPFDTCFIGQGRVVGLVDRFNRAGLAIFEYTHDGLTRLMPRGFPCALPTIARK